MDKKYVIICSDVDNSSGIILKNIIEEIANKWYRVVTDSNYTYLVHKMKDENCSPTSIRDIINERINCNVLVIGINIGDGCAAHGKFANGDSWKWLLEFCKKNNNTNEELPNAKSNLTGDEVGI